MLCRNGFQWQVIYEDNRVLGRAIQANVLCPAPGFTAYANQRIRNNPVHDSFLIFLSPDMIETIVIETNRQGHGKVCATYKAIDMAEMKSFIALLILCVFTEPLANVLMSFGQHYMIIQSSVKQCLCHDSN